MLLPAAVLTLPSAVHSALLAVDPTPADKDIKAGWLAFGVFLALAVAVVLLGISLTRHLRQASRNQESGLFGDADAQPEEPAAPQRPDPESSSPER